MLKQMMYYWPQWRQMAATPTRDWRMLYTHATAFSHMKVSHESAARWIKSYAWFFSGPSKIARLGCVRTYLFIASRTYGRGHFANTDMHTRRRTRPRALEYRDQDMHPNWCPSRWLGLNSQHYLQIHKWDIILVVRRSYCLLHRQGVTKSSHRH